MDTYPEPLERIFKKVEEESERRAQQYGVTRRMETAEDNTKEDSSGPSVKSKARRRGSISISRFGQLHEGWTENGPSRQPTPNKLSAIASKSSFYRAQINNDSTTSFASAGSAGLDGEADTEDDHHVTRMHTIVGRQSISKTVGGLLPRRLSRAHSTNLLATGDPSMVIGVSVEEATVESADDVEASRTVAYAPGSLRNQASKPSMGGSSQLGSNWVAKAKGFTKKFRRKSTPVLRDAIP